MTVKVFISHKCSSEKSSTIAWDLRIHLTYREFDAHTSFDMYHSRLGTFSMGSGEESYDRACQMSLNADHFVLILTADITEDDLVLHEIQAAMQTSRPILILQIDKPTCFAMPKNSITIDATSDIHEAFGELVDKLNFFQSPRFRRGLRILTRNDDSAIQRGWADLPREQFANNLSKCNQIIREGLERLYGPDDKCWMDVLIHQLRIDSVLAASIISGSLSLNLVDNEFLDQLAIACGVDKESLCKLAYNDVVFIQAPKPSIALGIDKVDHPQIRENNNNSQTLIAAGKDRTVDSMQHPVKSQLALDEALAKLRNDTSIEIGQDLCCNQSYIDEAGCSDAWRLYIASLLRDLYSPDNESSVSILSSTLNDSDMAILVKELAAHICYRFDSNEYKPIPLVLKHWPTFATSDQQPRDFIDWLLSISLYQSDLPGINRLLVKRAIDTGRVIVFAMIGKSSLNTGEEQSVAGNINWIKRQLWNDRSENKPTNKIVVLVDDGVWRSLPKSLSVSGLRQGRDKWGFLNINSDFTVANNLSEPHTINATLHMPRNIIAGSITMSANVRDAIRHYGNIYDRFLLKQLDQLIHQIESDNSIDREHAWDLIGNYMIKVSKLNKVINSNTTHLLQEYLNKATTFASFESISPSARVDNDQPTMRHFLSSADGSLDLSQNDNEIFHYHNYE